MTTPDDQPWSEEEINELRHHLSISVPVVPGIDPGISQDPGLYSGAYRVAAPPAMGTAPRMIYAAQQHLGEIESPPGSNQCPTVRWYNAYVAKIGVGPYCDMGVSRSAWESGNATAVCGGEGRGFALTTTHAADFQRRGLWRWGVDGLVDGAIVFLSWERGKRISDIDHVEIVERQQKGARQRSTIGFNVRGAVRREIRDDTFIVGYGLPPYGHDDDTARVVSLGIGAGRA